MATKEIVKEALDEIKPFQAKSTGPKQEYHLMVKTVHANPKREMGAVSGDELDMMVMTWLEGGYTIKAIHYIGEVKGHAGESYGSGFAYHFVKDLE